MTDAALWRRLAKQAWLVERLISRLAAWRGHPPGGPLSPIEWAAAIVDLEAEVRRELQALRALFEAAAPKEH